MQKNDRGIATTGIIGAIAVVALVLAAAALYHSFNSGSDVKFDTPYQAVLLTNGSVYFGKLEGYGTKSPVLRDVYYVQSGTDPETKQVKNILVHRGKELHAPDRMYLNPTHVILVEPVGVKSKVADLIAQQIAQEKEKQQ
ncbi:MAG: hypothetical protein ACLQOO_33165 [Terriglobia bacterium]